MGSGSYSRIIFGITDRAAIKFDVTLSDEARWEIWDDLCEKHDLARSYEGASDYVGIEVTSTLDRDGGGLVGVVELARLGEHVGDALAKGKITKAMKAWEKFGAHVLKKYGVKVPIGTLIWADDYD